MPVPVPASLRLGIVEPKDAVAAFDARGLLQPSFAWQDVWQEEHTRAFAVAGVQRLDVLQIFKDELDAALKEGLGPAEFKKALIPRLVAKGFWGNVEIAGLTASETRMTRFDERRLHLIYDVNMRQSHAAGRWARIERNKATMPFVMYRTMRDERVRAAHRPWDGVTLPVDDAWWDTHYPPCGWRCRCTAFGLAQKDIDRRLADGEKLKRQAPAEQLITYVNPRTGEVAPVPRGIDPGFAYNPGKTRDAQVYEASLRKALASYPLSAATAVAQAQAEYPAFVASATRRFGPFVDRMLPGGAVAGKAQGDVRFIGALAPGVVRAVQGQGIDLVSAVVAVRDVDVLRAVSNVGAVAAASVDVSVYRRLPELLQRAHALLLEVGSQPPSLIYLVDLAAEDGSVAKLMIQLEAPIKSVTEDARRIVAMNLVRTVTVGDSQALQDRTRYQLVWGRL